MGRNFNRFQLIPGTLVGAGLVASGMFLTGHGAEVGHSRDAQASAEQLQSTTASLATYDEACIAEIPRLTREGVDSIDEFIDSQRDDDTPCGQYEADDAWEAYQANQAARETNEENQSRLADERDKNRSIPIGGAAIVGAAGGRWFSRILNSM